MNMREMKDSGISWIPKIPINWSIHRLKYIVDSLSKGNGITKEDVLLNGDTPCVRYGEIYSKYDYSFTTCISRTNVDKVSSPQYFSYGDILFAGTGELIEEIGMNIVYLGDYDCLAGGDIIIARHQQNPAFLNYALNSGYIQSQKGFGKAKLKVVHISAFDLGNLIVALPPITEQKLIADYLDSKCAEFNSTLSDIQSQIEALEEYKRSVITEAVTKGLDPDVEMRDSGVQWIGMMPTHWDCQRGKYLLRYVQKPVRDDDGVITCFRDGEVTLRSNRREEGFTMADKEIGYQGIDVGDLVVHGMDGFAGSIGISDSRGKASPVLNVLDTEQNKRYIMYYLRSMAYNDVFVALATGIRVRSCDLRWNKLAELLYPMPPVEEQQAIVEHIDSVLERTNAIIADKKQQIETIEEYKKSLIFEYVTGKKEVQA